MPSGKRIRCLAQLTAETEAAETAPEGVSTVTVSFWRQW